MINKFLSEIGFAWTMRTSTFIILGLLAVANVTVRARLPPTPKPGSPKDLVMPFTEPLFCLTAMGAFLFSFGLFPPINYVISEAIYRDMGYDLALYMLPILNSARYVPSPSSNARTILELHRLTTRQFIQATKWAAITAWSS
jgi:hypothetical protein